MVSKPINKQTKGDIERKKGNDKVSRTWSRRANHYITTYLLPYTFGILQQFMHFTDISSVGLGSNSIKVDLVVYFRIIYQLQMFLAVKATERLGKE
jgi:hypothetical protein